MEINAKVFDESNDYAFISYCHDDANQIMRFVDHLVSEKYNIWIDKMIPPTASWDNEISHHIKNSKLAICFVTSNYLQSSNCLNEIEYARSKNVPILAILYPDTMLTSGLEMNLVRTQYITVDPNDTDEKLLTKIASSNHINCCKLPTPIPEPNEPEDTVPEAKFKSNDTEANNDSDDAIIGIGCIFVILISMLLLLFAAITFPILRVNTTWKECNNLSDIEPFDGELIWNVGNPEDPHGNQYSEFLNYAIISNNDTLILPKTLSVVYYLDDQYDVLTGFVAPHYESQMDSHSVVTIYGEYKNGSPKVLFCSEQINKKSEQQEIKLNLRGVNYLTLKISTSPDSAVILYDFGLWS